MARLQPKTDAQFQAEQDAHTMMEAEAITSDKARQSRARNAAKRLLKEEEAKLRGLRKVAKVKAKNTSHGSIHKKRRR